MTEQDASALATRFGARYGVEPALVLAIMRAESGLDPRAVSPAGASGLMQLMPGTARAMGVRNPFDPTQNVQGGTRYLRQLIDQFGEDTRLAIAAYNAGPGVVCKHGGVPPYRETLEYIARVRDFYGHHAADVAPAPAPGSVTLAQALVYLARRRKRQIVAGWPLAISLARPLSDHAPP